jgi:hypothetical protein
MRTALIIALAMLTVVSGDWLDDAADFLHHKINVSKTFIKEKALPAIKAKAIELKEAAQNRETWRGFKEAVKEASLFMEVKEIIPYYRRLRR